MSAPALTRRLALERNIRQADGAGGFRAQWITLGHLWAGVASGRFAQGSGVSWVVTVRGAPVGDTRRPVVGQRFRDGARVFRILAVTEADQAGRYLACATQEEGAT